MNIGKMKDAHIYVMQLNADDVKKMKKIAHAAGSDEDDFSVLLCALLGAARDRVDLSPSND